MTTQRELTAALSAAVAAVQQAQQHAMEARTQRGMVLGILRHFGCPEEDWRALELIKAATQPVAARQHAQAALEIWKLCRYDINGDGACFAPNDGSYVLYDDLVALIAAKQQPAATPAGNTTLYQGIYHWADRAVDVELDLRNVRGDLDVGCHPMWEPLAVRYAYVAENSPEDADAAQDELLAFVNKCAKACLAAPAAPAIQVREGLDNDIRILAAASGFQEESDAEWSFTDAGLIAFAHAFAAIAAPVQPAPVAAAVVQVGSTSKCGACGALVGERCRTRSDDQCDSGKHVATSQAVQPAAQQGEGEWQEAQRVYDLPGVHEAIQGFAVDQTGYSATMVVREVMRAIAQHAGMPAQSAKPDDPNCLQNWLDNAAYLLDRTPGAVRHRPGAGPENLLSSLIANYIALRDRKAQPDSERDSALREAVGKLIKAKGRFHTEQNYAALVVAYDAAMAAQQGEKGGA